MTKSKVLTTATSLALIATALLSLDSFARSGELGRHGHSGDARTTLLERLDSNTDGVLSLDEFSERNAQKVERHFDKKDADGDDLLSLEEFSARRGPPHPNVEGLDTDALGLCVEETLGYEVPERPDPATTFATVDANSDGSVDMDEILIAGDMRAEERFADIDSDGDAQLTSAEIDAHQSLRQEHRDAHRSCVGEQMDEEELLN